LPALCGHFNYKILHNFVNKNFDFPRGFQRTVYLIMKQAMIIHEKSVQLIYPQGALEQPQVDSDPRNAGRFFLLYSPLQDSGRDEDG